MKELQQIRESVTDNFEHLEVKFFFILKMSPLYTINIV